MCTASLPCEGLAHHQVLQLQRTFGTTSTHFSKQTRVFSSGCMCTARTMLWFANSWQAIFSKRRKVECWRLGPTKLEGQQDGYSVGAALANFQIGAFISIIARSLNTSQYIFHLLLNLFNGEYPRMRRTLCMPVYYCFGGYAGIDIYTRCP